MSTELTLEQAALAWAQGKRVEAEALGATERVWGLIHPIGTTSGYWNPNVFGGLACGCRFRIAPEPPAKKYRPWTPEEVPVGALTAPKSGGDVLMIVGRFSTGALLAGDRAVYPFGDLLKLRNHSLDGGKTWLPCGVEVSE